MLETLKALILDFQERLPTLEIPAEIPRRLRLPSLQGKATVCIGVRRCGKSTLLLQECRRLLAQGIPARNLLHLNFFDDRLFGLQQGNLDLILEAYHSLYPGRPAAEPVYCFFDEIQMLTGWEPFVERLLRSGNHRVWLTGSSARMLSTELATQMRGRALSWELFPLSFRELLAGNGLQAEGALSTAARHQVQQAFEAFRETGGFPEVQGLSPPLRVRIHQEYFHSVLYRDMVERHDVPHPRAVRDLAMRLLGNVASMYTINSLTGHLQGLGHKVQKTAVGNYLDWFEDAYFLFTVRLFDASRSRSHANPKKIYCVDHALVRSVSSGILVNSGHLLENLVFTALRRLHPEIHYYRTRTGSEVDFIVVGPGSRRRLIQVCESMAEPRTRRREMAALEQAMGELGLAHGTVVTRVEAGRETVPAGHIEILPVWRFLLDLPDAADTQEQ